MNALRRRNKLIKPGLQLKLVSTFVATAGLSALVQAVLLADALADVAGAGPQATASLANRLPSLLVGNLLLSFAVLLPLALVIGTVATFRIAGPLYRFESFLAQVAAGERPDDCRIRSNDELHELCRLINAATAPVRRPNAGEDAGAGSGREAGGDAGAGGAPQRRAG